jgi:hypothetical protein
MPISRPGGIEGYLECAHHSPPSNATVRDLLLLDGSLESVICAERRRWFNHGSGRAAALRRVLTGAKGRRLENP